MPRKRRHRNARTRVDTAARQIQSLERRLCHRTIEGRFPAVRRLAVQSFEREANLLVRLNHPGIPKIYDFFTESVRSYLVMEYVEGGDLEGVLDKTEGMLKTETVLDWTFQICDVLGYHLEHDHRRS